MAEIKNFRKAFNGFNREDVVRYLEHINSKHQNQVSQLKTEIEELRAAQTEDQSDLVASLQQENADLTSQLEEAQGKAAELEAAQARIEELEALLASAQETARMAPPETLPELETYRRAERIEREARERAELIYFQASNVLKEANAKLDGAMQDMTEVADQAMHQLTQLQMIANNSKLALQEATDVLKTLRSTR